MFANSLLLRLLRDRENLLAYFRHLQPSTISANIGRFILTAILKIEFSQIRKYVTFWT